MNAGIRLRLPPNGGAVKKTDLASIVQFDGKLDLARWTGGLADNAKPAPADDVGGQSKIDFVEDIEELHSKLKIGKFTVTAMTNSGVLDQRQVKIAEAGTAKGVAAKRAETAVKRPGPARYVDRNYEK